MVIPRNNVTKDLSEPSLGMYARFHHPEIVLLGIDLDLMHRLINDAGEQIRRGHKYEPGLRYDDLLKDCDGEFRAVGLHHYRAYLGYGVWYYQGADFPAVRCDR
jgi:hypothetical protein